MYGKLHSDYPADTPEYMVMAVSDDVCHPPIPASSGMAGPSVAGIGKEHNAPCPLWDATMIQRPLLQGQSLLRIDVPMFLAMNRFVVKPDAESRRLFEERWETRNSKLSGQNGFIGFSLLRRARPPHAGAGPSERFTYATATLWASQDHWTAWREGGGRSAHAASQGSKRTPVSEWMAAPASPIFWDVPVYVNQGSGVRHVCPPVEQ